MKKYVYLVIGVVLCLNGIFAVGALLASRVDVTVGIIQSLWGLFGIYLIRRSRYHSRVSREEIN